MPTAYTPRAAAERSGWLRFLLLSTGTPAVTEFAVPEAGKTAYYMLRWLSTHGEAGPWSETLTVTISA